MPASVRCKDRPFDFRGLPPKEVHMIKDYTAVAAAGWAFGSTRATCCPGPAPPPGAPAGVVYVHLFPRRLTGTDHVRWLRICRPQRQLRQRLGGHVAAEKGRGSPPAARTGIPPQARVQRSTGCVARCPLAEMLRGLLLASDNFCGRWLEQSEVRRMVEEYLGSGIRRGYRARALLMLELWARECLAPPA